MMTEERQNSTIRRPNHRLRPQKEQDRFLGIRQWLNSIFMLGQLLELFFTLFLNTRIREQSLFLSQWYLNL